MNTFELIVQVPFDGYERGERITDQLKINDIVNSERKQYVTPVLPEDKPE